MKCAFVLLFAFAAVSVSASPVCTPGALSEYVALGAEGCSFDGVLFSNFQFTATGGPVISDIYMQPTGTMVGSGIVTSPVLDFLGTWYLGSTQTPSSLSLTISYNYAAVAPFTSFLFAQLQGTAQNDGPSASENVSMTINGVTPGCSINGPSSTFATSLCVAPPSGFVQDTAQIYTEAICARCISDTGEVGNITNGFLLKPVPEPRAVTLMLVGFCGLVLFSRRSISRLCTQTSS